ncbi:hypothetical protein FCV25MIE_31811 [Fagus crenata]
MSTNAIAAAHPNMVYPQAGGKIPDMVHPQAAGWRRARLGADAKWWRRKMGEIKAIGARGCERGGLSARAGGVARMVATRFCSSNVEVTGVLLWVLVAGWGLGVLMRVSVGFGFGLGGFGFVGFLVSGWVGFGWMFGGMGYGGSDFGPNGFLSDCWTDFGVVGDPCGFLFG